MKFSNTALLALIATASVVSAAPTEIPNFESSALVTRQDANEVLDILSELKNLNAKRTILEGEELVQLQARADSLIGQLITALANSGILGDIWNTLTTDEGVKTQVSALIQSAIQTAIVQGPALIKAIWNSGLISNIFNSLLNDKDLQSALFAIAKSLFSSAANLLLNFGSGSSAPAATPAAAAPAAAAPAATPAAAAPAATPAAAAPAAAPPAYKREDMELLDKKDLSSLISTIVTEISNSGILTSLVNTVLADPQKSISLLTSALSQGLVLFEDVYGWAKSSGVLDQALSYLSTNGGSIVSALGKFLANALSSGTITASQINNAGSTTTTATAAAPAAAAPATTAVQKRMLY
ncbi:Opaque-phase-specific protein OP4 [[Candida] zeylanoides]